MTGRDALQAALDRLCPMHLWLEPGGAIRHAAPTLLKLRPRAALVGQAFDTVFSLLRPRPGPGLPGALP
ncbi:MAG: GGDEF domain-containing protein, partial [Proteobacteria bacterium]|nr:GGDEF domain-containing protein [Pseudomonadota bacterium]